MTATSALKTDTPVAQVSSFVQSLQEPRKSYISPARFSKAIGINVSGMARLTGVHRNTMRNPASDRVQERLRQIVRVISAATELTGDINKAIFWYRNEPIIDYRHQTAAELVAQGHTEAVLAYIDDLANGANG